MKLGDKVTTQRLILRHWDKTKDGNAFFRLSNDPQVMAFFPHRRSREESDQLMNVIANMITENGYGWTAVALKETGQVIGMAGIAAVRDDFPNGPGTEIGWRFLPEFWHQGYATEAASAFLEYGFEVLGLNEIMAFAVQGNAKSFAVMERIGMRLDEAREFDHPSIPDERAELRRHNTYAITRDEWLKQKTAG
ncbi:GNAT family N-acetyltransferase [Ahrensia kielensis]|uniref:GNAT family N-acetyltransferase n=1 Tax=Ahrensia kielensis TaxID=76980 RepID=A0ABU9T4I1_9HYPH